MSDVQTAFLSGHFFSEVLVPTPAQPRVRLPESFTADNYRPPTPIFAENQYEPKFDPRFTLLTERFINNNDILSDKRKEPEFKRLQNTNFELKFAVKIEFQGLNPLPVFQVSRLEHKKYTCSLFSSHL